MHDAHDAFNIFCCLGKILLTRKIDYKLSFNHKIKELQKKPD
jgi:hypothetical protein